MLCRQAERHRAGCRGCLERMRRVAGVTSRSYPSAAAPIWRSRPAVVRAPLRIGQQPPPACPRRAAPRGSGARPETGLDPAVQHAPLVEPQGMVGVDDFAEAVDQRHRTQGHGALACWEAPPFWHASSALCSRGPAGRSGNRHPCAGSEPTSRSPAAPAPSCSGSTGGVALSAARPR